MNSYHFQKTFRPSAPDKGSFPLDHDGECKKSMLQYMVCIQKNNQENTLCRQESKNYLKCRMEHNLMTKDDWKKLGYSDDETVSTSNAE